MPEKPAGPGRRFHRLVDLRQPAVVGLVLAQRRVGRDCLPEPAQIAVVPSKTIARLVVGQAVLRRDQPFVAGDRAIDSGKVSQALLHCIGKPAYKFVDVRDDASDAFLVELDRLGHVVEDAQVVDDQAVCFCFAVGSVGAADRLQQRVVAQRLVEIHRLQDRRVEAGEQLRRDDQDLQWIDGSRKRSRSFSSASRSRR